MLFASYLPLQLESLKQENASLKTDLASRLNDLMTLRSSLQDGSGDDEPIVILTKQVRDITAIAT